VRLLGEQVAMSLDQIARLVDYSVPDTTRFAQGLEEAGCVEGRRFLTNDYRWYWPTRRGLRLAGMDFHYREPGVTLLPHRRAINEVRLHLRERAPTGRWLSERIAYRRRAPGDHIPDAIFEIDGERHAIEVELSRKPAAKVRCIIAEHSERYDAVVYFCSRSTYAFMTSVMAERRWPKLVVSHLPTGE